METDVEKNTHTHEGWEVHRCWFTSRVCSQDGSVLWMRIIRKWQLYYLTKAPLSWPSLIGASQHPFKKKNLCCVFWTGLVRYSTKPKVFEVLMVVLAPVNKVDKTLTWLLFVVCRPECRFCCTIWQPCSFLFEADGAALPQLTSNTHCKQLRAYFSVKYQLRNLDTYMGECSYWCSSCLCWPNRTF